MTRFTETSKVAIGAVFDVSILILIACSLTRFLSAKNYYCELLSHLHLVWFGLLCLTTAIAFAMRRRSGFLSLAALVIAAIPIASLYVPANTTVLKSETQLRFLQMNLWGGKNRNFDQVTETIRNANPDVIGFSEITKRWNDELQKRVPEYKYTLADTRHGGIAIFSKLPLKGKVEYFSDLQRPRINATVTIDDAQPGTKLHMLFVHPVIPIRLADKRNAELKVIAAEAQNTASPMIIAGDLNCTPWSQYFDDLLQPCDLHDTEQGFGPQCSWNAFLPIQIFPIDHVLASRGVRASKRTTLNYVGSDHLPVLVDLNIGKAEMPPVSAP